jgi:hypothetical protein
MALVLIDDIKNNPEFFSLMAFFIFVASITKTQ